MKNDKFKRLNLGCGRDIIKYWVNVDKRNFGQDEIYDLNQMPYPWDGNTFDAILMKDIIEHLKEPNKVFKEIFRVAKNGATVVIRTPHPKSPLMPKDPEHFSPISLSSLMHLSGFEVIYLHIHKYKPFRVLPMRYGNVTCVVRVIK